MTPTRGTKTTEGLSLLFTTAGITVQGPQPQIERLLVWSVLDSATCQEKLVLPDGRHAAIMELTSGGQSIRFLLPTDTVSPGQAAYLDQALPAWLSRYKGVGVPVGVAASTARPSRSAEAADPQMSPSDRGHRASICATPASTRSGSTPASTRSATTTAATAASRSRRVPDCPRRRHGCRSRRRGYRRPCGQRSRKRERTRSERDSLRQCRARTDR